MSQEVPEGSVIELDGKGPTQPPQWIDMRYTLQKWSELEAALSFDTGEFDCLGYIKNIWFDQGYDTWDIIKTALELVKHDELVRINWLPILNTDKPDDKPSITNQVPLTCGVADGENYFRGISPLNVVSVAHFGLHPSLQGAGSDTPMLYTCKSRQTPFDIYSEIARIPMDIPGSVVKALKGFRCVLGIVSKLPYPHHSKKLTRKGADKHQFLFAPQTYDVKWVEFIPTDPNDIVIHRRC